MASDIFEQARLVITRDNIADHDVLATCLKPFGRYLIQYDLIEWFRTYYEQTMENRIVLTSLFQVAMWVTRYGALSATPQAISTLSEVNRSTTRIVTGKPLN